MDGASAPFTMNKTILYFVKGLANAEQITFAAEIGAKIRNASKCFPSDAFENCDSVIGEVPAHYMNKGELHPMQDRALSFIGEGSTSAANEFDRKAAIETLLGAGIAVTNKTSTKSLEKKLAELE